MAKTRISWSKVSAGDVVEFRYQGKKPGSKSRYRTALILNERHMYTRVDGKRVRLVHMLQLSAIPKRPGAFVLKDSNIKRLFKKVGPIELREGAEGPYHAIKTSRQAAKRRYNKLRELVTAFGNYRTFSWHRLRSRAVFMSEFEFPEDLITEELKIPDPKEAEEEAKDG